MTGRVHQLVFIPAIVWTLSSLAIVAVESDVARIEPEHPVAGGTITITYDAGAPKARLGADEDIIASWSYWSTDHVYHHASAKMQRAEGKLFTHTLPVPAGAAVLSVSFSTSRSGETVLTTLIDRPDGVPVRTAWEQSMLAGELARDYLDRFAREMALYPDSFAAYRNKWFVAGAYDRETVHATIEKDMRHLRRKMRGEPLEGLYSLSYGHGELGHESEARAILRRMMALYPAAPLTAAALSQYEYQAYSQRWPSEGTDEVAGMLRRILVSYPNSQAARDNLTRFIHDKALPLESVEAIADGWMHEEPDNPVPAYLLASAYENRGAKLEEAAPIGRRAVDGMLLWLARQPGDTGGSPIRLYLPGTCLTAARIEMKLDHPGLALGYAKTAEAVDKETDPDAWLFEGSVWDALRSPREAETAYLEAYRRGSKEAEEALRTAYQKGHGNLDGFAAHLGELTARPGAGSTDRKPAPDFKVTAADGTEFDSRSLRGKVVVLNFWGTGCGPCKAEIPDLNRLVKRYHGSDVVFLALTMEGDHDLASFLAEHPFAYRVIPRAWMAFQSYGVDSLPVHVVVGKQGEIVARLLGSGEARAEQLGRLIDQALASSSGAGGPP